MSLIDEYAISKVRQAKDRIIKNQLEFGITPEKVAQLSEVSLTHVNEIKREYDL